MGKSSGANESGIGIRRVLLSGGIGLLIVAALMMVTAALINIRIIPEGREEAYGIVCLFIGSAIAGLISAGKNKTGKALSALLSAVVVLAVLILSGAFIKDCNTLGVKTLVNIVCVLLGCACGCLLTVKRKRQTRKRA